MHHTHFDALLAFVARLNSDDADHIGYFSTHPVDISQTLQDVSPPLSEGFQLAYDGEYRVGVLGVDAKEHLMRAFRKTPAA